MDEEELLEKKEEEPSENPDDGVDEELPEEEATDEEVPEEESTDELEDESPEEPAADETGENEIEEPDVDEDIPEEAEGDDLGDEEPEVKTFTQDEVDRLVGKARKEGRESGRKEILESLKSNYGLDGIDGLGEVYGKSQQFDYINGEYQNAMNELSKYKTQELLRNSNINPEKFDDIQYYFKGKGLPLDEENLSTELEKHGDWIMDNDPATNTTQEDTLNGVVNKMSSDIKGKEKPSDVITETAPDPFNSVKPDGLSEKDRMKQMFYGHGGF